MTRTIISIDQGTTSSRSILFNERGKVLASAQKEFRQIFPQDGWVEHDPEEIWETTLATCQEMVKASEDPNSILGIGITNQRETCLFWDKATGTPLFNAIVWQDRRGATLCEELREQGHAEMITEKTGLLLDSYFSATKAKWLLDNHPGAREKAAIGDLLFGTIETFLLWRLSGGKVHATEPTNACRTMLFNTFEGCWDEDLLDLFDIPRACLPEVKDTADDFGTTSPSLFGHAIPIKAMIGDQQAALVGQTCFEPGDLKSTYGTGCFVLLNTGTNPTRSSSGLLTSVGYRLAGETTYVLEGSIFNAGTTVQWMRDNLGIINDAAETEAMAAGLESARGLHFVPAFTGLGAPHWDPDARGAILGITRDTMPADIVRAGLESVCYQTEDLLRLMQAEAGVSATILRVDGGMIKNDWLAKYLSDITNLIVERPTVVETTAMGAALLVGYQSGLFDTLADAQQFRTLDRHFEPTMNIEKRTMLMTEWHKAVSRVLSDT